MAIHSLPIDLTKIQPDVLPSVALANRKQLPKCSSIYFAIANGRVQYIGRAKNMRTRWAKHHRYDELSLMDAARIAYMECPADLLDEIEEALISWFNPPLNGLFKPQPPPRDVLTATLVSPKRNSFIDALFEGCNVRHVVVNKDEECCDGWVASDVCKALKTTMPYMSNTGLDETKVVLCKLNSSNQVVNVLYEPAVYRTIFYGRSVQAQQAQELLIKILVSATKITPGIISSFVKIENKSEAALFIDNIAKTLKMCGLTDIKISGVYDGMKFEAQYK